MQTTTTAEAPERLLSFGLLQPRYAAHELLAALRETGAREAAELLFRHKISSMAKATAERLAADADDEDRALLAELAERVVERASVMRDRWRSAPAVGELVAGFAAQEGIEWWTMKGFSFRPLYPEGAIRDVGDLDVLVRTMDDAWRLARRLREDGYIYLDIELPWFKRDIRTQELYGQIRLTTPNRDRLSIDIHAGPYSIRHCALMPLSRTEAGLGTPAGPVAFEDDVCAVVANAAGDFFITAKMINDLLLALGRELDVAYIHRTLDAGGLLPFFATCLGRLDAWCALTGEQAERAAELTPDVVPEPVPSVVRPDAAVRCEVTVAHARATAERLFPEDPAEVEAVVASAREAYSADHPLRAVPDEQATAIDWDGLNNWACVRLVPAELAGTVLPAAGGAPSAPDDVSAVAGTDEATRSGSGTNSVVHAIGDVFVPTVDFALPASVGGVLAAS
ncbi:MULTISPECIES: nucleotidyltransferase family protein [unclassified Streptomyces]|uniref:nucleotidyltransferase family protein n=1 Tax=unclassified Streptomyces TaxID=2593676 RepID=UPI00190A9184|nr:MULTISPECIES: nucleotidyltransferase family protein [unclassified Streptomyces]MBK3571234.1 nucleotidyltransferase family protein [Streptomyces sp. MBT62]MBK6017083.1 nucleotidyltransferase family protein [Streptomyces sp. MBT53]